MANVHKARESVADMHTLDPGFESRIKRSFVAMQQDLAPQQPASQPSKPTP